MPNLRVSLFKNFYLKIFNKNYAEEFSLEEPTYLVESMTSSICFTWDPMRKVESQALSQTLGNLCLSLKWVMVSSWSLSYSTSLHNWLIQLSSWVTFFTWLLEYHMVLISLFLLTTLFLISFAKSLFYLMISRCWCDHICPFTIVLTSLYK